MSIRFRLLTETDVKAVLTMDDLIETMSAALQSYSGGGVTQPVRTVIPMEGDHAFFGLMPALVRASTNAQPGLGAKLVTVVGSNDARGLPSHLASILLLDPETGALQALLDGRFITEARTAAVSAVSVRHLARANARVLAILGSGVQAHSHLQALPLVREFEEVRVWSPHEGRLRDFAARHRVTACDSAEQAVRNADVVVLATASTTPVIDDAWVAPGTHVIAVGACRPAHRETDPRLVARALLVVDSRAAAMQESGDILLAMADRCIGADHIHAELGEVASGAKPGRRDAAQVTLFKSLGLAIEDAVSAGLAWRRAIAAGVGLQLDSR